MSAIPPTSTFPTPLPPHFVAPLEAIQRTITLANARVIAITSPRTGIDTAVISAMLCRNMAASDTRAIMIDAFTLAPPSAVQAAWSPGQPIPDDAIEHNVGGEGYDRFEVRLTSDTRPLFNNLERLQRTLRQDLMSYGAIVVHLPPVLETDDKLVNPVSVARATDAVFLTCATDRTLTGDAMTAIEILKSSNVMLAGTILDNSEMVKPGGEIARYVEKTWLLPGFMRRPIASFFRSSALFNA